MRSGDTAVWDISGLNSDALSLWIGMNKKGTSDASVQIYGDGTLLYTSVPFNGSDNAISVYLDITGVKILKFCADGKNGSEQIALADVMLEIQKEQRNPEFKSRGSGSVSSKHFPYTGRPRKSNVCQQ